MIMLTYTMVHIIIPLYKIKLIMYTWEVTSQFRFSTILLSCRSDVTVLKPNRILRDTEGEML